MSTEMPDHQEERIKATTQKEADAIGKALTDPEVRAFVVIVGVLQPFSKTMQGSILRFVSDCLNERAVI